MFRYKKRWGWLELDKKNLKIWFVQGDKREIIGDVRPSIQYGIWIFRVGNAECSGPLMPDMMEMVVEKFEYEYDEDFRNRMLRPR